MIVEVRRQRSAAAAVLGEHKHGRALLESAAGLALLVASGVLIVSGAKGIASAYGVDPFIVGATLVAIGTILGSNISMDYLSLGWHPR